jgi:LCP family protein required for cell wall assembly
MMDIVGPARLPRGQKALPVLRPMAAIVEPQPSTISQPTEPTAAYQAPRSPLDMELPGAASPSTLARLRHFKIHRSVRRRLARATAVAMVLVLTLGGLLFSQGYLKLHKVFRGGAATAAALQANVNPDLLKGEGSGRINVLLLGRGGGDHDGPDLTDSMMIASIDPVNHKTTLISLPRDLWVSVPNHGDMKINAAWETGEFAYEGKIAPGSTDPKAISAGFDTVDQTVESALGISIDYNMLVDFQAFQQAVDTVGGVSVNVPTDLVDPTMAWQNGGNPVLAKAGVDEFNGTQALTYVRSRETTSDFARAQRQRDVLIALKTKIDTLGTLSNPLKISGLMNTFGNNVQTDLSIKDATRLYSIMKDISGANINSTSLDQPGSSLVTTANMDGQSIVLPQAGLFNYSAIQLFVRGQLKDPYILKENAKIMVVNGTNVTGLATQFATQLQSYGYNVIGTGNTANSDWTQTQLVDLNPHDKYTKNYLEQRYNTKSLTQLPDNSITTNGADFVIILGSDEANLTQP